MDIMSTDEFEPRTVDKVERLLDLLDEMERHPSLKGKLALHGGTAINLFMLDVPRLSVDIDVSYIGSVSRAGSSAPRALDVSALDRIASSVRGGRLRPWLKKNPLGMNLQSSPPTMRRSGT